MKLITIYILFIITIIVLIIKGNRRDTAYKEMLDTCRANFDISTTRDSLTIIENEPRCAEVLGK